MRRKYLGPGDQVLDRVCRTFSESGLRLPTGVLRGPRPRGPRSSAHDPRWVRAWCRTQGRPSPGPRVALILLPPLSSTPAANCCHAHLLQMLLGLAFPSAELSRSHSVSHPLPSQCQAALTLRPLKRLNSLLVFASVPFTWLRMPVLSPIRTRVASFQ